MPMNIWWIRRDLRLTDNPALSAALAEDAGVTPVYILDPLLLTKPAPKRLAFLFNGLRALEQDLKNLGSGLIVREGDPQTEIPRLAAEVNAGKVCAEADLSPYARRRDEGLGKIIELHLVGGLGVHPVDAVCQANGK